MEFAAESTTKSRTALIRPGRLETPASLAAMTKGEAVALVSLERRSSLSYGTRSPMKKIVKTKKKRIW